MKNSGIILVGAAIAALLLFRKSGEEGGSGGSLSIPLDVIGSGAVTRVPEQPPAPVWAKKATNTSSPSSKVVGGSWLAQISEIAKAGFSTEGISGIYDPATDTIYTPSDRFGVGPGKKPPRLDQATTKNGLDWTAVSSAKKAGSGSSSKNNNSDSVNTSGWSSTLHSRMGVPE